MLKKVLKKVTVLTVLLLSPFLLSIQASAKDAAVGFGVSPSDLQYDQLLRGSHLEQEFTVSRSEYEDAVTVTLELDGGDAADWFQFNPGTEFSMASGEQTVTFSVVIDVPNDAQLVAYEPTLTIKMEGETQEGKVNVVPGVLLNLGFTVTQDEVEDWEVRQVDIADFAASDPMVATVKINNKGNVAAQPSKVVVEIKNLNDELLQKVESTDVGEVAAYAMGDLTVSFSDVDVEEGEYYGYVMVYDNGTEVFSDRVVFNVTAATTPVTGLFEEEGVSNYLIYGGVVVGLVALLAVVILLGVILKGKKKDNMKQPAQPAKPAA